MLSNSSKFTWTISVQQANRTVYNSPKSVRGLSMDGPLIKHQFHFVEPRIHGHFLLHNTQNHFHGFLDKEYPSRRRPLHPRVDETPQYWYPRVSFAVEITFASCLTGIRQTDHRKSREKVDFLSLKLSPSFPLSFFLSLFPPQTGWVKLGQENCPLTCYMSPS